MKNFRLLETESEVRIKLEGEPKALASAVNLLLTLPNSTGLEVENLASIHVQKPSLSSALNLLKGAGWTLLMLALLLLPVRAFAFCDDWEKQNTVAEITFMSLATASSLQTAWDTHHRDDDRYVVRHPIIGRHPDDQTLIIYTASALTAHAMIACALPPDLRLIWQFVWIGIEINTVSRNLAYGVQIGF